ncbi:uncharacterized protein CDAR_428731 [Caerostris darwini]|uniref:RNase H type-1 domain-containing protein n=1 Tax=Caerostris darwini TaxID=1538125 RepID=A0AAV4V4E7_9ARAC|nr:uncharacterized protein CDAR_428731 [Caerostris darwini]
MSLSLLDVSPKKRKHEVSEIENKSIISDEEEERNSILMSSNKKKSKPWNETIIREKYDVFITNDHERTEELIPPLSVYIGAGFAAEIKHFHVVLLAEVFENFRTLSMNYFELDPVHFYTTPSLTWSAGIKTTKVRAYSYQKGLAVCSSGGDQFQDIWTMTDSRASIQHLCNWGIVGDQTSLDILKLLDMLSSSHTIHFQWISSHVEIEGNEKVYSLAKSAAEEDASHSGTLTFREISFLAKIKMNKLSKTPPIHSWYLLGISNLDRDSTRLLFLAS